MRDTGTQTRAQTATGANLLLTRVPRVVFSVFMVAAILVWVLPLIGLVISSFRPFTDATSTGWWTTIGNPNFTLGNFKEALGASGFLKAFVNSLLITVPTVSLVVVVSSFAAFALIWTDLPGRRWLYAAMVGLLVVPPEITLVPTLNILKTLHLINTFPGIWLSHVSAVMPFAIFLLGNFFAQIPG
ncbi:MAG: carbohydrate ABC transporter permease, partial [Acidimicrobiia bacterium]